MAYTMFHFLTKVLLTQKMCNLFKERYTRGILSMKGALKIFAKFTEKYLCQSLFFYKVVNIVIN